MNQFFAQFSLSRGSLESCVDEKKNAETIEKKKMTKSSLSIEPKYRCLKRNSSLRGFVPIKSDEGHG